MVLWAVILTCPRRYPNSRPGSVQNGEISNLSDNARTSWFFSECAVASLYLWILLHPEIPLKPKETSYQGDMKSRVSHVNYWDPHSSPAEEWRSSSIRSGSLDFCVALPAQCCVMLAKLMVLMCKYNEVSCISVVLATATSSWFS